MHRHNLQETYVDNTDPWMGILAAAAFVVRSTYHHVKGKSLGQLVFGWDMILPIVYVLNWRCIYQRKKTQTEKDIIYENSAIIDHNYRVWFEVTIKRKSGFKHETTFQAPYEIVQMWKNGTVTLRVGAVTSRINTLCINPYSTENTQWHSLMQPRQTKINI